MEGGVGALAPPPLCADVGGGASHPMIMIRLQCREHKFTLLNPHEIQVLGLAVVIRIPHRKQGRQWQHLVKIRLRQILIIIRHVLQLSNGSIRILGARPPRPVLRAARRRTRKTQEAVGLQHLIHLQKRLLVFRVVLKAFRRDDRGERLGHKREVLGS